jgi:hypothetical protein
MSEQNELPKIKCTNQHPYPSSSSIIKVKRKGTGNLLQDLISCSVLLDKNTKNGTIEKNNSVSGQCSICQQNEEIDIYPLSFKQLEIVNELLVFLKDKNKNRTASLFQYCCLGCAATLDKLINLNKQIEIITSALKALLGNQLIKRDKITTIEKDTVIGKSI